MAPRQPVARKATIKKAKADFKSRGQPTISNSERKQIERGAELDRRAWGIEQREKRKAEATLKKKLERERREKEERAKIQMGTQVRCDRFGYKSSQFHLGKFFGAARTVKEEKHVAVPAVVVEEEEDLFGDDGVDDDTLLEALESPNGRPHAESSGASAPEEAAIPPVYELSTKKTEPAKFPACDDMLDFWDELGSSTQIARELEDDSTQPTHHTGALQPALPRNGSHVEATSHMRPVARLDSLKSARDLMPPPPLPTKNLRSHQSTRSLQMQKPSINKSYTAAAISGFTMSELEDFVDDDLQLTQTQSVKNIKEHQGRVLAIRSSINFIVIATNKDFL